MAGRRIQHVRQASAAPSRPRVMRLILRAAVSWQRVRRAVAHVTCHVEELRGLGG